VKTWGATHRGTLQAAFFSEFIKFQRNRCRVRAEWKFSSNALCVRQGGHGWIFWFVRATSSRLERITLEEVFNGPLVRRNADKSADPHRLDGKGCCMKCYENRSRQSPVVAYEFGENSITIKFMDGSVYLYTYENSGNANVEQMKKYAIIGHGLNGFITRFLKKGAGEQIQQERAEG
jgi:hypothetical protein